MIRATAFQLGCPSATRYSSALGSMKRPQYGYSVATSLIALSLLVSRDEQNHPCFMDLDLQTPRQTWWRRWDSNRPTVARRDPHEPIARGALRGSQSHDALLGGAIP